MAQSAGRVTLWGIEVFLAIAEGRSISAAARRLVVSTAAISQQLAGLEAALGTVLFDRGSRPLGLTPAGAILRRHAQTIVNAAEAAQAELAMADLAGLTALRLGVIEDLDADVTPDLLTGLAGDLPTCRFLLETGPSHRLCDQLEARALDLVVAADPGPGAGLEVHRLLVDPFLAVLPKGGDVGVLPFIQYSARHVMGRQIAAHLARQTATPHSRFELDSYHAILAMVAAGQGWSILTPLALHHVARFRGAVELRPLTDLGLGTLEREITLSARAGLLQGIPAMVAGRLRGLIGAQVVAPMRAEWPFLTESLRLL